MSATIGWTLTLLEKSNDRDLLPVHQSRAVREGAEGRFSGKEDGNNERDIFCGLEDLVPVTKHTWSICFGLTHSIYWIVYARKWLIIILMTIDYEPDTFCGRDTLRCF